MTALDAIDPVVWIALAVAGLIALTVELVKSGQSLS